MRSSIVAGTLSLLLLIAPGLRAQDDDMPKPAKPDKAKKDDPKDDKAKKEKGDEGDDEGDDTPKKPQERLPFNPWKSAKKGDWSYCVGKMKILLGDNEQSEKVHFIFKVKDVTADEIKCTMAEKGAGRDGEKEVTFSLKENPTFSRYMSGGDKNARGDEGMEDWKTDDAKKTVGGKDGKEFACKKVTCKVKNKMQGIDGKLTFWLSDETKGWGLIAMTLKGTVGPAEAGGTINMEIEVKGFGNGDTADFGNNYKAKAADDDEDAPKKDTKDKKDKGDDDGDAPKKKDKKDDDK